jgi:hypothetical protein
MVYKSLLKLFFSPFLIIIPILLYLTVNFAVFNILLTISVVWLLPTILGYCFFDLLKVFKLNWLKELKKYSLEITFFIYWIFGLILQNIPYVFDRIIDFDIKIYILAFNFIVLLFYLLTNFKDFKNAINEFLQSNFNLLPKMSFELVKFKDFFIIGLYFLLAILYFYFFYLNSEFTSKEFDYLQNFHLGNYFLTQRYEVFGHLITPMYSLTTYTTALIPVYSNLTRFLDVKDIPFYMMFAEIFGLLIATFSISKILRVVYNFELKFSFFITCISFILINVSSIYLLTEIINQQVVVMLFPSILLLFSVKKYRLVLLLLAFCLLFHTIATFLVIVFLSLYYFLPKIQLLLNGFWYKILLLVSTIPVVFIVFISQSQQIMEVIVNYLLTKTDSIHVLEISNRDPIWRTFVVNNSFGFGVFSILIVSLITLLFLNYKKYDHIIIFVLYTFGLTFTTLPFVSRLSSISAIPISIMLGIIIGSDFNLNQFKERFNHIIAVFITIVLFCSVLSLNYLRTSYNRGSEYFIGRFFNDDEYKAIDSFYKKDHFQSELKNNDSNYEIVSDYITQHIATVQFKNYLDQGLYETNPDKKINTKNILAQDTSINSCSYFSKKYLVYIISERSQVFARMTDNQAKVQLNNIWRVIGKNQNILYEVNKFKPINGKIINEEKFNDIRFITVLC